MAGAEGEFGKVHSKIRKLKSLNVILIKLLPYIFFVCFFY